MLYAFVKQILCFLFCILAVITCHVQMLLVADISLALPSNQKPQKNSANGKKKQQSRSPFTSSISEEKLWPCWHLLSFSFS